MIHKRKGINTKIMFCFFCLFLLTVSAVMNSVRQERVYICELGFEFVFTFQFWTMSGNNPQRAFNNGDRGGWIVYFNIITSLIIGFGHFIDHQPGIWL